MQRISLQPCFTACGETPLAHILRLGDVTLLLDAGWTTEYLEEDLAELRSALPSIDAGQSKEWKGAKHLAQHLCVAV